LSRRCDNLSIVQVNTISPISEEYCRGPTAVAGIERLSMVVLMTGGLDRARAMSIVPPLSTR
jgi:hypothetical protein